MSKRDKSIRQMVETRKLYHFEHVFMRPRVAPAASLKPRSEDYLQALADQVWARHGRRGMATPKVRLRDDIDWSWCVGYSLIELSTSGKARNNCLHNTVDVLLHELVHAIGYRTHGRSFVRKYIELLVEFAGYEEGELQLALSLFKIKH
jgi:hypothetical protein